MVKVNKVETITKLPDKKGIVGAKEIAKAAKSGKVKHIIVASNCPQPLIERVEGLGVKVDRFDGDQAMLGTKLGKPFSVSMVGFE